MLFESRNMANVNIIRDYAIFGIFLVKKALDLDPKM